MDRCPIPKFLKHLKVFASLPVPFFVKRFKETPDFRVVDPENAALCLQKHLCGICGRKLGLYCYFIGGPKSKQSRLFADVPMHQECARYSMQACPFLRGDKTYSSRPIPEGVQDSGIMDTSGRPETMFILRAKTKAVALTSINGHPVITVPGFYGCETF